MKTLGFLLLGIVYVAGIVLFILGGGGHSPNTTYLPIEPLWIGLVVNLLAWVLAPNSSIGWCRYVFLALIGIHYLSILIKLLSDGMDEWRITSTLIGASPHLVLVPLVWYVMGQCLIWFVFARSRTGNGLP